MSPFKPSSLYFTFLPSNPLHFPLTPHDPNCNPSLHSPPHQLRTMNGDPEVNRKRKNVLINVDDSAGDGSFHGVHGESEQDDADFLALSLSNQPPSRPRRGPPSTSVEPLPPLLPPQESELHSFQAMMMYQPPPVMTTRESVSTSVPPQQPIYHQENLNQSLMARTSGGGVRRKLPQPARHGKSETVPAPFPWATTYRATVHSMSYLLSKQIFVITGEVQCKKCEKAFEIEYDLREKFAEIGNYIAENKSFMHDRAPAAWMNPVLPRCKFCDQENCAKPVISAKKKKINWLFLLLGQMLGCLTLKQLKYFCEHTKTHRTGAKDRILYYAYLGLCKQLDPTGPFDISR